MTKKKKNEVVEKEIAEFESKHGNDVAFKWGGKWVKKKDVLSVDAKR